MTTPYALAATDSDEAVARSPATRLPFRRISWGAVFAGMVIAVGVQLVLSLVGAGVGLSTIDPLRADGTPDASSFGIGAAVWWVIASAVALYAGGWVAGHLANSPEKSDSVLHGLLAWGLATLLTVYLLASAIGSVVAGGAGMLATAARVTATGVAAAAGPAADMATRRIEASGFSIDDLKAQARELLAQTGIPGLQPAAVESQASAAAAQLGDAAARAGTSGEPAAQDLQGALQKVIASGKETIDKIDRDALVNVIMTRANVSRAEAEQRVDGWVKSYENARATFARQKAEAAAKTRQVADAAAAGSSKAALGAAAALILGAVAAALGGLSAGRRAVAEPRRAAR